MDQVRIENLLDPSSHEHRRRSSGPKNALIGAGMTCIFLLSQATVLYSQPSPPTQPSGLQLVLGTPPPGAPSEGIINVPAGGDLQTALNDAKPGDTILLEAGATFTGNFVLPAKSGNGYVTIRSSAPDAALPPSNARITPSCTPRSYRN